MIMNERMIEKNWNEVIQCFNKCQALVILMTVLGCWVFYNARHFTKPN
jgi:hypothetical protein